MNKENTDTDICIQIQWDIIQTKKKKKKGNPVICDDIDEPERHQPQ